MLNNTDLDILVAEKIFGWSWVLVHHANSRTSEMRLTPPNHPEGDKIPEIPLFSTEEGAARMIIRKVRELNDHIQDKFYAQYTLDNARPGRRQDPIVIPRIDPRQICLAALRAVGHEI